MKKQNKNISIWETLVQPHLPWWVALVFLCIAVATWWVGVSYVRAAGSYVRFVLHGSTSSVVLGNQEAAEASTTTIPRLLDGVVVTRDRARFWPYGVMVENLLAVRPQSGLSQASVVYETLAEGGSTRFLAIFDPSVPIKQIMPVRSARPYYLEWASEYGALYAHAGGSPKALTVIWETKGFNDLNALSRDGKYFWRDTAIAAPHNLVTSSDKMVFALRDKGLLDKPADFSPWLFKDEAPLGNRGVDGKVVSFNFSSGKTYLVDYRYDQNQNSYLRSNAGVPHLDKNTGQQIAVKNVIVQLVKEPSLDNTGKGRLDIYVGGQGKAWVFRDGQSFEATWKKASRTDRTRFYDAQGQEVPLNRGNTWVAVVPETQTVTYR